jgi:uncharacterized membrane protein
MEMQKFETFAFTLAFAVTGLLTVYGQVALI